MTIHGDSLEELKALENESVDLLCTDPPYGYSFMGKSWDKTLPDIGIFKECFRVLKPGAFAFVMSAPRSDVCARMMLMLEDAGFEIGFTPIYWSYASGFPKAMNITKKLTKDYAEQKASVRQMWGDVFSTTERAEEEHDRRIVSELLEELEQGECQVHAYSRGESESSYVPEGESQPFMEGRAYLQTSEGELLRCEVCSLPVYFSANGSKGRIYHGTQNRDGSVAWQIIEPNRGCSSYKSRPIGQRFRELDVICDECRTQTVRSLDGSYGGFQPKPAVEVVIVAMKPLSEKTYVDQALKNGKGITWLDDCRIPSEPYTINTFNSGAKPFGGAVGEPFNSSQQSGRFPANLLCSDDVLNDGKITKSAVTIQPEFVSRKAHGFQPNPKAIPGFNQHADSGSYSRFFSLDAWAQTLPFLAVPKASKSEKNAGLSELPDRASEVEYGNIGHAISVEKRREAQDGKNAATMKNHHPTVKPLKLMSYLITLGSRPGDTVLDPFMGSGTTCIAAKELGRQFIGIEREAEYVEIAEARINAANPTLV